MKKLLLFILLGFNLTIAQNQSVGTVASSITNPVGPQFTTEIFRFRPGLVTQLDFNAIPGQGFDFINSRWFAFGRVPAGTQTFYGLRFQLPRKAITMGYNDLNALNPRIEWIGDLGTGNLGNLEYRVGTSQGVVGAPGANILVATMTKEGNTNFGISNPFGNTITSPKVGIIATTSNVALDARSATNATAISASGGSVGLNASGNSVGVIGSGTTGVVGSGTTGVVGSGSTGVFGNGDIGVKSEASQIGIDVLSKDLGAKIVSIQGNGFQVQSFDNPGLINRGGSIQTTTGNVNVGLVLKTDAGSETTGIDSFALSGNISNIGVKGTSFGQGSFEAGIYGDTPNNNGNQWAGFFNGDIFTSSGSFIPSDRKLKTNVIEEVNVLEKLSRLKPVTYDYLKTSDINLSSLKQHGFISQELAEVFPELTRDVTKPVFDKDGKKVSSLTLKAINYVGLISVLTSAVNELSTELKTIKNEFQEYKSNSLEREKLNMGPASNSSGFVMEQNIPNPFKDQTQIKYELPERANSTSIIVFDLNGKLIKEYFLSSNIRKGILVINSSDIGKGFFIYSMVENGSEIMTKKMIVK